jgi:hypothetical protein
MSPQAVRANPRGTRSDTKTWTHTTRHTMAVHLRAFASGESPTVKIVWFRELVSELQR